MIKVETNGVEIKNFKKVVIIYNPNSGKQIFVSMLSRVLDLKRRLTAIIGPNRVELTELREFKKLTDWADKIKEEKYDWVIVAGGDGIVEGVLIDVEVFIGAHEAVDLGEFVVLPFLVFDAGDSGVEHIHRDDHGERERDRHGDQRDGKGNAQTDFFAHGSEGSFWFGGRVTRRKTAKTRWC